MCVGVAAARLPYKHLLPLLSVQVPYVNTFTYAASGTGSGSMGGWAGIAVDQTDGKVRLAGFSQSAHTCNGKVA